MRQKVLGAFLVRKIEKALVEQHVRVLLFALGSMVATAEEVRQLLLGHGIEATLVNARFAKPFDQEYLMQAMKDHSLIVTMEENVVTGGFGEQVACFLREQGYEGEVLPVAIPDAFVEHGNVNVLKQMLGMDAASVADRIIQQLS